MMCQFIWLIVAILVFLFISRFNFLPILIVSCRYAYPWWKEKVIDSVQKRKDGLCPLTPEETVLALKALGIDQNLQIYIAAGEIFGGQRRMDSILSSYPNLVFSLTN